MLNWQRKFFSIVKRKKRTKEGGETGREKVKEWESKREREREK